MNGSGSIQKAKHIYIAASKQQWQKIAAAAEVTVLLP
jgi:hypothetical protein